MKGLAGSQTRGLPVGASLECADNTGAKVVQIVTVPKIGGVHRRYPAAGVGDMVVVTVKKGTPEMRRQILYCVVIRQRRPFQRSDGVHVQFEDNACVVINKDDGEVKGSVIKGPVAREAAERWARIAATATTIV